MTEGEQEKNEPEINEIDQMGKEAVSYQGAAKGDGSGSSLNSDGHRRRCREGRYAYGVGLTTFAT